MDFVYFFTKQAKWARKYLCTDEEKARADWWVAEIEKLKAKEAEAFPVPPAPAAPVPETEHAHA